MAVKLITDDRYATTVFINFRMWEGTYRVPATRRMKDDEFYRYLLFSRQMIGYVVAPKIALCRLFFGEVMELLKKRGICRQEVKKAANSLICELDRLERLHTRGLNGEFMEIMTASMAGKALAKTNELRGAIGGALMNAGVKEYVFYSYPYTVMELLHEGMCAFNAVMGCVREKCGVYLDEPYKEFMGEAAYQKSVTLMCRVVDVIGERIPRVDFGKSGAMAKVDAIGTMMLNMDNLQDAFKEAVEEVGNKQAMMMDVWDDSDEVAEQLSTKYNVKKEKRR